MNATLAVNPVLTQTFDMPRGWTLRSLATAIAREWLAPFRPQVTVKADRRDRWSVLPIVEAPVNGQPLWEEGIATEEYEERLERLDLTWSIQARCGRPRSLPRGVVLARLSMNPDRPASVDLVCSQGAVPESLFDAEKLAPFLRAHGSTGIEGLFAGLLTDHGFRAVTARDSE